MAFHATASLSFTQRMKIPEILLVGKKTQVPGRIDAGPAADLPLDGTGGFLDMANEPRQGALPTSLRDMGVPADCSDNRVVEGKLLISIKCGTWEEFSAQLVFCDSRRHQIFPGRSRQRTTGERVTEFLESYNSCTTFLSTWFCACHTDVPTYSALPPEGTYWVKRMRTT
jgi:hypothetical protein